MNTKEVVCHLDDIICLTGTHPHVHLSQLREIKTATP